MNTSKKVFGILRKCAHAVPPLEDGSLWEVDPIDTVTSSIWLPVSDIIICGNRLINEDDNETVHARRLR